MTKPCLRIEDGTCVTDHGPAGCPPPGQPSSNGHRPTRTALSDALDLAHEYLQRFVAFPDEHAAIAAALWAAHAHQVEAFDSTPRLAFLSPEPGSGKTRALEALAALCPNPMHAVNATPAALFRAVSDLEYRPTIMFDEIDTIFGPKAKDNEEVRGFLNAGHRRAGVAYRCVGLGTVQKVVAFPAFCAVALAGLHDVPDTIASRAIIVRMRRRKPDESVEPFRARIHEPQGHEVAGILADAMRDALLSADPHLPPGVTDRPADVWEPLLAVAQAAGGPWPQLAAGACTTFVQSAGDRSASLTVQLLRDLRTVFGDSDQMHTTDILAALHGMDESPWADLRGKPLDSRGIARRLRDYGVRPVQVFLGGVNRQGYRSADLADPWSRYLPRTGPEESPRSPRSPEPNGESTPFLGDSTPFLGDSAPFLGDGNGQPERELGLLGDLGDLR